MVSNRRCNPPTTRTPHTTHVSVGARTRPRVAQYPLPLPLTLAHSLPRSFSLSFTPRAEPHRIPRDKTKPGRVPSFIRGRGAASGSSAAPSGPVRLSRQTFSPAESTGVRPVLNPPFTRRSRRHRLPPPRVGSRPPLGADTPASTTERPGAPGFLNILFTRRLLLPLRLLELRCLSLCLIIARVSFSRTASAAALV